jgi:nickel/cobalt transporter (NicO) family protein
VIPNVRHHRSAHRSPARVLGAVGVLAALLSLAGGGRAEAHPLGNFTTNTALHLTVHPTSVDVAYVLDLAEIPALKARQKIGAPTGTVPEGAARAFATTTCTELLGGLNITSDGHPVTLESVQPRVGFLPGQAGLSTLRLECTAQPDLPGTADVRHFEITDTNYANRIGWREITASGDGTLVSDNIAGVSPSHSLKAYPQGAVTSPLHETSAAFDATPAGVDPALTQTSATSATTVGLSTRGNDGITRRFESLVAGRRITPWFAFTAMLFAVILGSLHALAPGHGKTIMAAYAVTRRGDRRDILAIGATVAVTHTIGILLLGALVSATSVVTPTQTLRWASVLSGLLVMVVGGTLVRNRWSGVRSRRVGTAPDASPHPHPLPHSDHDHDNDHAHADDHAPAHAHADDHAHAHTHADDHAHDHGHASENRPVPHPTDPRFIVTSHAHGGWKHDHVLPAPGANVRRRELIAMGLAGGLVPSPSALVVLLAAIALGRLGFGIGLVVAYGTGLAGTLVGAGLMLVHFERRIRTWTTARRGPMVGRAMVAFEVLPVLSGLAMMGAGIIVVLRTLHGA